MAADLDHLRSVAAESARFCAVLRTAPPGAVVPTCPEWDAADLVWHLAEVQSFWSRVVEQRCSDPEQLSGDEPERPDRYDELLELAEQCTEQLTRVLGQTPPATPVWTWSDDQSVGFVVRRQAHEALIHRVDAECTTGQRTALDPALATDGVDEALRVMFSGGPPGTDLTVDELATVRLRTTDTGASWVAVLAQFEGPDGQGGTQAGPTLVIGEDDDGLPCAASVSASAADLDCWLWGRPPLGSVELAGDVRVLAGLRAVVDTGIA
jgi:uncharacterized protein (TIGR03083 family)